MVDIHTRKPEWLRVRSYFSEEYNDIRKLMRGHGLCTVCEEAACPNIGECWKKRSAAFLILGDTCTRGCAFCNVKKGVPPLLNPQEPQELAKTVESMKLAHVVITSVTRDDLPDGGAGQFAACIKEINKRSPSVSVEVLTPDFQRKEGALQTVLDAKPEVFNHNLETIRRLYPEVRKGADYDHSLHLLAKAKGLAPDIYTKSGVMVGLGETKQEIFAVMDDLRSAGVEILTIGQYLRPSASHREVDRYVTPEEFKEYEIAAKEKGFKAVSASPLTRSSHNAGEVFSALVSKKG